MIVFAHLYNDTSGSPRILSSVISAFLAAGHSTKLYIGSGGSGFLNNCAAETEKFYYRRSSSRILTLFFYLFSQIHLFIKLVADRSIEKDAVIYVNTLMPFAAAVYGRLTGRRVIYHIHEISISPKPLRSFLTSIVRHTSSMNMYVSDAHRNALPIDRVPARRLYNALDHGFSEAAEQVRKKPRERFVVLMVCSLRAYKGVDSFVTLARSLADSELLFQLVVNDEKKDIDEYFAKTDLPRNLSIAPRTNDVLPFYAEASVLVNLTRTDMCVETFGMTLLEAMAFGIPVIAPPVGGPAELIKDGREGFLIDSRNDQELAAAIRKLADDTQLYERMSTAGRQRVNDFSISSFTENLFSIIRPLLGDEKTDLSNCNKVVQ